MNISIYQLKARFQNLLRPFVRWLEAKSITANQVTVFAMLGSAVVAGIILGVVWLSPQNIWVFAILPIWMFIRMALNAIDGMLAREFNQTSDLGMYLNELMDVVSDTLLYLPFVILVDVRSELILLVIFLSIISEYVGVLAPMIGAPRNYHGPMGKSDRAFIFGTLGLLISIGFCSALLINLVLFMMSLLLILTIKNRIQNGITSAKQNRAQGDVNKAQIELEK